MRLGVFRGPYVSHESIIFACSMPVLVRKPEVYVYTIALEHLEQPGEQLDAGKRAYHSLTTSFVWDQPNV